MQKRRIDSIYLSSLLFSQLLLMMAPWPFRKEEWEGTGRSQKNGEHFLFGLFGCYSDLHWWPLELEACKVDASFLVDQSFEVFLINTQLCIYSSWPYAHIFSEPRYLLMVLFFFFFLLRSFAFQGCPLTEKIRQFYHMYFTLMALTKCTGETKASCALSLSRWTGNAFLLLSEQLTNHMFSPFRFVRHELDINFVCPVSSREMHQTFWVGSLNPSP